MVGTTFQHCRNKPRLRQLALRHAPTLCPRRICRSEANMRLELPLQPYAVARSTGAMPAPGVINFGIDRLAYYGPAGFRQAPCGHSAIYVNHLQIAQ